MRTTLALLLVVGCGGPQRPAATRPACEVVAAHLLELAEQDNAAAAPAELGAGIRSEAERQCRETPWTAGRRECLLEAPSQDATLACPAD